MEERGEREGGGNGGKGRQREEVMDERGERQREEAMEERGDRGRR